MSIQIAKTIKFNNYNINLFSKRDFVKIQIINNSDINNEYESSFKLKNLQSFKQLNSNKSSQEIVNFIFELIKNKKIDIECNENQIKLIMSFENHSNIELLIDKKKPKLIENNQIDCPLNLLIDRNDELQKKVKLIISKYDELHKFLKPYDYNKTVDIFTKFNERLDILEKKYDELKKENNVLKMEINIKDKKISSLDEKINNLEYRTKTLENIINKEKKKKFKGEFIVKSKIEFNTFISTVSIFPNGNIISGSANKMINIYDNNLNIIQKINEGHSGIIFYIDIKDDNNFVSCSSDKNIITWIKKENHFEINKIISPAHEQFVRKILYFPNNKIISCSFDQTIKIWDENSLDNLSIYKDTQKINSMLLLKEENVLIISGENNTKFFDLKNYELKKELKKLKELNGITCKGQYAINRLDKNRIIIGGNDDKKIKVISIFDNNKIVDIINDFICTAILSIQNKEIFLVGGQSHIIKIFNSINYECIQSINNIHSPDKYIKGFNELKNGNIISFSADKTLIIWEL